MTKNLTPSSGLSIMTYANSPNKLGDWIKDMESIQANTFAYDTKKSFKFLLLDQSFFAEPAQYPPVAGLIFYTYNIEQNDESELV